MSYKTVKNLRLALRTLGELYLQFIKKNVRFRERRELSVRIDRVLERLLASPTVVALLSDEELDLLRRICAVVDSQASVGLLALINPTDNGKDSESSSKNS